MLIVWMGGGIGNQLFQYAFMRHLEELKFPDVRVETSWYYEGNDQLNERGEPEKRTFDLEKMQTKFTMATAEDVELLETVIYEDESYSDVLLFGKNAYVAGYWQDLKYLSYVEGLLQTECRIKPEYITSNMRTIQSAMEKTTSVSLHVRRGDYLNEENRKLFAQCTTDYYERAVLFVKNKCDDTPTLFVFSDDIKWAKEHMQNFCGCKTVFVEGNSAVQDLYLLSCTKHSIIANSSFSWWGAYLNAQNNHITVAPERWFTDKPNPSIYPDEWVVL